MPVKIEVGKQSTIMVQLSPIIEARVVTEQKEKIKRKRQQDNSSEDSNEIKRLIKHSKSEGQKRRYINNSDAIECYQKAADLGDEEAAEEVRRLRLLMFDALNRSGRLLK